MTSSRFDHIADIAGADDWKHDPFGTAIALHFDIASVLDMSDIIGDVTPGPFARWQYRRAPFTVLSIETVAARADDFNEGEWADDFTYGQVSLAAAVESEQLSQDDLIYVGDVLDRYAELLRRNGRDY